MSSATLQRPALPRTGDVGTARTTLLGLAAGVSAALAGVLVTVGLSLVVWAVTPAATDPMALMRAAVTAFAAGNGADVTIGAAVLTLSPLLLGLFGWTLLWQAVVRTPQPPTDLPRQAVLAVAAGLSYGLVVPLTALALGTPGAVTPGSILPSLFTAVPVAAAAVLRLSADTRARWAATLAGHWTVGFRLAGAGAIAVVGVGALTLVVALVLSFGQAVTLAGASVGSGLGDGLGLLLLGLAYLPNVILGAIGFATGAGVQVGEASFGPFGSTVGDLPALPLLAALPDSSGGALGLAALVLPVLLGGVLGWVASARLHDLRSRCLAIATSSTLVGFATAVAALLAAGGVSGGRWADTGVSAWAVGLLLTVELAVAGALVAVLVPRTGTVDHPKASRRDRRKAGRLRVITADAATEADADDEAASDEAAPDGAAPADSVIEENAVDNAPTDDEPAEGGVADGSETLTSAPGASTPDDAADDEADAADDEAVATDDEAVATDDDHAAADAAATGVAATGVAATDVTADAAADVADGAADHAAADPAATDSGDATTDQPAAALGGAAASSAEGVAGPTLRP